MIHLFIDFKYWGEAKETILLDAICKHQFDNGTQEEKTYTALSLDAEFAFSQKYRKTSPGFCSHGNMFKHEKGFENPSAPSYDDLIKLIPQN